MKNVHRHPKPVLGRFEAFRLKKVVIRFITKPIGAQKFMSTCAVAATVTEGNCVSDALC